MEYPIAGLPGGSVHVTREGLYWSVRTECARCPDHPVRVLAETDGKRVNLGVLAPCAEGARAEKRLSVRSFSFTEGTRVTTDEHGASLPEPFDPERPFARIAEFSDLRVIERDGALFWSDAE